MQNMRCHSMSDNDSLILMTVSRKCWPKDKRRTKDNLPLIVVVAINVEADVTVVFELLEVVVDENALRRHGA